MEVSRFDVFLVALDPTIGREIKTTRPCTVVSPDEMNHHVGTAIIAPMTAKGREYPTRVACTFHGVEGQVVLDQLRTVDKTRLVKKLGRLSPSAADRVLDVPRDVPEMKTQRSGVGHVANALPRPVTFRAKESI